MQDLFFTQLQATTALSNRGANHLLSIIRVASSPSHLRPLLCASPHLPLIAPLNGKRQMLLLIKRDLL